MLSILQYFHGFFERLKQKVNKINTSLVKNTFRKIINIYIACKKISQSKYQKKNSFSKEKGTRHFYIGITRKKLKTRNKEHIADIV